MEATDKSTLTTNDLNFDEKNDIDQDDCLYFFELVNNKYSFLDKSLLLKHESGDCRLLCRILGIYSKDNLNGTIDKDHKYYDAEKKSFTIFRTFGIDLDTFLCFTNWLRFSSIDIDMGSDINQQTQQQCIIDGLKKICATLGADELYKALQIYLDKKNRDNIYNPMTPDQDTRLLYKWMCLKIPQNTNVDNFNYSLRELGRKENYSQTFVDADKHVMWLRSKQHDL